MKWFKHDSNAYTDAKLKRVRMKYGMTGYGLYWYCLELVAMGVEAHKLTFELEHDAEIIAHDTGINYALVQEMMVFMCDLGLFENTDGRITCLKMATRLDQSMTSNPTMRKMISGIKSHDGVMMASSKPVTESCKIRLDKIRLDEKRVDIKHLVVPDGTPVRPLFDIFYERYPKKAGRRAAETAWKKIKNPDAMLITILDDIKNRVDRGAWCIGVGKAYIPNPATYLNQQKWQDEIIPRPEFKPVQDFSRIAMEAEVL